MKKAGKGLRTSAECFICGSNLDLTEEHLIPKWLQKLGGLLVQRYKIPNDQFRQYKGYKGALCKLCNQSLSSKLEFKISGAFKLGFQGISTLDRDVLFYWLMKIYYGSLVRDSDTFLNPRNQDLGMIIDPKELKEKLPLMKYLLKGAVNLSPLEGDKPYSLFIFKITHGTDKFGDFDYGTLRHPFIIFMRHRDVGIICCLQDGGILNKYFLEIDFFRSGSIHVLQFNEILAWISYKYALLEYDPNFVILEDKATSFPLKVITLQSASLKFKPWKHEEFKFYIRRFFSEYPINISNINNIEESITFIHKGNHAYFSPEEIDKHYQGLTL